MDFEDIKTKFHDFKEKYKNKSFSNKVKDIGSMEERICVFCKTKMSKTI